MKKRGPSQPSRKHSGIGETAAGPPAQSHCVFVGHATYDKFLAKTICDRIDSLGPEISTFRDDRDISGGDTISHEIKDAIRNCGEFVVLLTPISITRQWVLIEIGMAEITNCRIVPLLYHIEPKDIPQIIQNRRAYTLDQIDDYLADLRSRVCGSRS